MIILKSIEQIQEKFTELLGTDIFLNYTIIDFYEKNIDYYSIKEIVEDIPKIRNDAFKINEISDLIFQTKDMKFLTANFVKVLLAAEYYNGIYYFLQRFMTNNFADIKFVIPNIDLKYNEKHFERYIEIAQFSKMQPEIYHPFVLECLSADIKNELIIWQRAAAYYLAYFLENNDKEILIRAANYNQNYSDYLIKVFPEVFSQDDFIVQQSFSLSEENENDAKLTSDSSADYTEEILAEEKTQKTKAEEVKKNSTAYQDRETDLSMEKEEIVDSEKPEVEISEESEKGIYLEDYLDNELLSSENETEIAENKLSDIETEENQEKEYTENSEDNKDEEESEPYKYLDIDDAGSENNEQLKDFTALTDKSVQDNNAVKNDKVKNFERIITSETVVFENNSFIDILKNKELFSSDGKELNLNSIQHLIKFFKENSSEFESLKELRSLETIISKKTLKDLAAEFQKVIFAKASIMEAKWAVKFVSLFGDVSTDKKSLDKIEELFKCGKSKEAIFYLTGMFYSDKSIAEDYVNELAINNEKWAVDLMNKKYE